MVNTLFHRAHVVCTTEQELSNEKQHLCQALQRCQFPPWTLSRTIHKNSVNVEPDTPNRPPNQSPKTVAHISVPYAKGISESVKNIMKKKGIQVHFRPAKTLKKSLVHPKDKVPKDKKCGVIYHIKCSDKSCSQSYVGETARSVGERLKEHVKAPSPIHAHCISEGHQLPSMDQISILAREGGAFSRYIKESMYIRALSPALNNNIGKFGLPQIWNTVLNRDNHIRKLIGSNRQS